MINDKKDVKNILWIFQTNKYGFMWILWKPQVWDRNIAKHRENFLREILHKNLSMIPIQRNQMILSAPLEIFSILLSEIPLLPAPGKRPYRYELKLPVRGLVITTQYGKNKLPYSVHCAASNTYNCTQ